MPDLRDTTEPGNGRSRAVVFAAIGGSVGIGVCILQLASGFGGPPDSPLWRAVQVANWPVSALLELFAMLFYNGNTDQLLGWAIPALFTYWLLIGATLGLAYYWIPACCRKR